MGRSDAPIGWVVTGDGKANGDGGSDTCIAGIRGIRAGCESFVEKLEFVVG